MLRFERILCPVDFSEFSVRAYDYAYSLARHYKAKVFVQHVMERLPIYYGYMSPVVLDEIYGRQAADDREQALKLVERRPAGVVDTDVVVQSGPVPDTILEFAGAHDIDLITMGTHGRRGLDRLMVGSTIERVLRKARCAVLAVHEPVRDFVSPASAEDPVQIRKILWCTDFSEHSPRALEYALSLASQYQAEITMLHVLESGGGEADIERARQALEDVIPDEARTWATVVPAVRTGRPYEEITKYATQAQTDLIVTGVRGRNIVDLAVFGSTTHRVIQLGPCPVLVVRT